MRILILLLLILPVTVTAQLKLPPIFSGNMVLQRNAPIAVWGKAIPGDTVFVQFGRDTRKTIAGADSGWIVHFRPRPADTNGQRMHIRSGMASIELNNLLMGDVWLCIGQSNMEWPMYRELHYRETVKDSHQPMLRFYNPTYAGKNIFAASFSDSVVQLLHKDSFYSGNWQVSDSSSFRTMSAVAWYFGRKIGAETGVPVGLINLSIGGAPLETFIAPEALRNSGEFTSKVNGDWMENEALPVWVRERGKQNVGALKHVPSDENGKFHAYKPGFAYQAGIEPILPMAVSGIINYQGESNAQETERVKEYAALNRLMVQELRRKWKKRLPYYFVQLSSIDTVHYKGQLWPWFRDEQRKILQLLPNSGMAVSSDAGARNDVHPTNKKVVGERLAAWALRHHYKKNVIPSGPLALRAKYRNGFISISFRYAKGLHPSDGAVLKGFSTDGQLPSEAFIRNKRVVVAAPERPVYIYYGWNSFSNGNLVNDANLPASTFKLKVK